MTMLFAAVHESDHGTQLTKAYSQFVCSWRNLTLHSGGTSDALVRDQIMSMKTTFTPGHYRRRVAGVLGRRLLAKLF